jgi:hypothetical protein
VNVPVGVWLRCRVAACRARIPTVSKKSKQFVSIKKICLSKCFSEIEMPGELHPGPGQPENLLKLFLLPMMATDTTTWSVRAIEL